MTTLLQKCGVDLSGIKTLELDGRVYYPVKYLVDVESLALNTANSATTVSKAAGKYTRLVTTKPKGYPSGTYITEQGVLALMISLRTDAGNQFRDKLAQALYDSDGVQVEVDSVHGDGDECLNAAI